MQLQTLLLAAAALATPAAANDLFVGSLNTSFAKASPPTAAFQPLGACGGVVAGLAGDGGELFLAAQFELLYRYRADTQQTEVWSSANNEQLVGIAVRGHEVLVATASAKVIAYDRARGTFLRQWDLPVAPTTISADRGQVWVGTSFGLVMELLDDGTTGFLGGCGASIQGIAASSTELFLGASGSLVWRVDRATGFVTSSFPVVADPTAVAYDQGRLFVGTASGLVYTYDVGTASLIATRDWFNPVSAMWTGTPAAGVGYCFGEWSACPCGAGDPLGGCPSHVGIGARLVTYGSASVAADDLELAVLDLPRTTLGRFYMGGAVAQVPFGNGLLCAGSGGYGQFRFPVQPAQTSGFLGAFRFGPGIVAHSASHFGPLGAIQVGSSWHFQAWFRDAQNPCGGGFNTSNATTVTFQP